MFACKGMKKYIILSKVHLKVSEKAQLHVLKKKLIWIEFIHCFVRLPMFDIQLLSQTHWHCLVSFTYDFET